MLRIAGGMHGLPSLDCVPTSGRLVFPPGVTELSVKTRLIDEARFELTENFYLRFEDPSEWISGASPTSVSILDNDPRSELRILSIQPTTSGAVLSFSSLPDRSYVIERSHQIGAPQWVTALSVGRGNGEVMRVEVRAPVGIAASFFRVREL